MDFITPYIKDGHRFYLCDSISTNLSLALWLTDAFSEQKPIGQLKVMIKEGKIKATRNLSGYYTFVNLTSGTYTVCVESELYFTEETSVDLLTLDPKNPAIEIKLTPNPSYPFQSNATLARGQVLLSTGPLPDADIKVVGKTIQTITDENGEFVLYFKGIKTEVIAIEIKKDMDIKTVSATINEGVTTALATISFP